MLNPGPDARATGEAGQSCAACEHICASTVPIFAALGRAELQQVNDLLTKKEFRKGEVLFTHGEPGNQLYIVRHGRVKLYTLSTEGRQQTVRILEHGDFFGELALFKETTHALTAEALTDTGICLLAREAFRRLLADNASIALAMLAVLSERLARAEEFIGDLTLKNSEQRLASWLLLMAEKGARTPQGLRIALSLTRQELANLLGTTTETVSRKLSAFQEEGIITTQGYKTVIILDREQLAARAGD